MSRLLESEEYVGSMYNNGPLGHLLSHFTYFWGPGRIQDVRPRLYIGSRAWEVGFRTWGV